MLFLLTPITGAMALAAHAVVGEKQARTLEPLLATPITTAELLVAKVLGALTPTLVLSGAALLVYFCGIALFAEPGVMRAMLVPRTLLMLGFLPDQPRGACVAAGGHHHLLAGERRADRAAVRRPDRPSADGAAGRAVLGLTVALGHHAGAHRRGVAWRLGSAHACERRAFRTGNDPDEGGDKIRSG